MKFRNFDLNKYDKSSYFVNSIQDGFNYRKNTALG